MQGNKPTAVTFSTAERKELLAALKPMLDEEVSCD
jgi:hypothetical protein